MSEQLNVFAIEGRITREPEIRFFDDGNAMLKLSVAVNERAYTNGQWVDEASFFTVKKYLKSTGILDYLTVGRMISASGKLKQERWEKDGQKRSAVILKAYHLGLGELPHGAAQAPQTAPPQGGGAQRPPQRQASGGNPQASGGYRPPAQTMPPQQQAPAQGSSAEFEDDIPF